MGSPRLLLLASVASAGRVYHLTDIHVDPIYVVNSSTAAYCNGPVIKNASLQAPIFGAPVGDCATPEALYDSALAFMADQPAADMVLFTGDFTQAGLQREAGADSVLDTIAATHEKLRAALPGVKVYGAVGNHDSYPGDVFDFPYEAGYGHFAALWDVEGDAKNATLRGGYFSQRHDDALVVISLNTNYLSMLNPLVKDNSSAAHRAGFDMMAWFGGELAAAEQRGDVVYVLGHIPGESWLPAHSLTYQRLMQRYAATVKGQFYGHDHEDYVRLTRECDDATCTGSATGVVFVGPSLTEGWPSENPAVRVYVTDGNYTVEDALTYTADILEANEKGAATWVLEYSAKDRLRLDDLSPRSWEKYVALQLATNESAFDDHVALRRRGYRGPRSRSFFNDADYQSCVKN
ncbi:hypothetical protein JL722_12132 [Aureococcus anophagefferens]|nr:hypothetical protein JL722_12132 [Aureococcus anophagefferens]